MGFTSVLYDNEPIFHDSTPESAMLLSGAERGLVLPMSHNPDGGNYGDLASAFPPELLIPKSEWQARIQEKEEKKNRISDYIELYKLPVKRQTLPYCWIFSTTHAVEVVRLMQNQEMVVLSATSTGAKIKDFRSQGGWCEEALRGIIKWGLVPINLWPENALQRKYDTPEAWAEADKYRITEWYELKPRTIEQEVSLLLRNIPTAVGQNHWSHAIMGADAVWLDGGIAIRRRNSWGPEYGANGFFIQQGFKALADDAIAPRVAMGA